MELKQQNELREDKVWKEGSTEEGLREMRRESMRKERERGSEPRSLIINLKSIQYDRLD
jgi:hypothetical protein